MRLIREDPTTSNTTGQRHYPIHPTQATPHRNPITTPSSSQVQSICRLVVRRSARMAAVALMAILRLQVGVGVDGGWGWLWGSGFRFF